ncbi:hypothetical protein Mal15_39710 [Stieleria maiorica]|uniref:Transmembrane protein n=1 Tax=Stieleria maiorica TaxID=2795974 RepID=A0A5B9MJR6_9BACT|nr:hypothetical protein [Stieleria maiorica]QEF99904.1 hypothetical protein Mal15_39710 [Stieleria maiorica]
MSPPSPDAPKRNEPPDGSSGSPSRRKARVAKRRQGKTTRRSTDGSHAKQTVLARPADSATADEAETVASLVRRLGTPPHDLASRLGVRFKEACRRVLDDGGSIAAIELESWAINRQGELVFLGEILPAGQGIDNVDELGDQFQQRLAVPRPAIAHRSRQLRVDQAEARFALRFQRHADDDQYAPTLSGDERDRREKLIDQFTASLARRFGEQAITSPDPSEEKVRPSKPQPMARDRRFNWNLTLGLATAVAAVAMVLGGTQLAKMRKRQAELGRRDATSGEPESMTHTADRSSGNASAQFANAAPVAAPEMQPDVPPPPSDPARDEASRSEPNRDPADRDPQRFDPQFADGGTPNEPGDPPESSAKTIVDSRGQRGGFDVMDDLDALVASNAPSGSADNMAVNSDEIDPAKTMRIASPLRTTGDVPAESTPIARLPGMDVADDVTLEDVLSTDAPEQDVPEVLQETRPSEDRFVELPPASDTAAESVIDQTGATIERLDFPSEIPIVMSGPDEDGTTELINQQSGNRIAQLTRSGPSTVLRWSESASKDRLAQKLLHGRLVLSGGEIVYLRPSIETDAYPISMDPRELRPSWKLGGPLLPEVARLEIDLQVPDSIDLAWHTPLDPNHARDGTAIAILTPTDGETVAIAVKMEIDCSRTLSCRLQYGARLDSAMPWSSLSQASFAMENTALVRNRSKLLLQRDLFKQSYGAASTMERTMMRGRGERIDAELERLDATIDRMSMLGELAIRVHESVKLNLHAFVQWPDAAQTLLRTKAKDQ